MKAARIDGSEPGKRWRYAVWSTRYPETVWYFTGRGEALDFKRHNDRYKSPLETWDFRDRFPSKHVRTRDGWVTR